MVKCRRTSFSSSLAATRIEHAETWRNRSYKRFKQEKAWSWKDPGRCSSSLPNDACLAAYTIGNWAFDRHNNPDLFVDRALARGVRARTFALSSKMFLLTNDRIITDCLTHNIIINIFCVCVFSSLQSSHFVRDLIPQRRFNAMLCTLSSVCRLSRQMSGRWRVRADAGPWIL